VSTRNIVALMAMIQYPELYHKEDVTREQLVVKALHAQRHAALSVLRTLTEDRGINIDKDVDALLRKGSFSPYSHEAKVLPILQVQPLWPGKLPLFSGNVFDSEDMELDNNKDAALPLTSKSNKRAAEASPPKDKVITQKVQKKRSRL
jgi:hypothetical protein